MLEQVLTSPWGQGYAAIKPFYTRGNCIQTEDTAIVFLEYDWKFILFAV